MNHIALSISLLSLLGLGCAASPDRSVSGPSPSPSSSPDIAQVSEPSQGGVPCAQEVALDCPGGVDGCLDQRTTVHACVATTAQPGPSCSQEIALECPAGEIDACLATPPAAANHLCIQR